MEKISVVIPCRNEEKTIGKLIDQILSQRGAGSLFSFEILIVEGRSTDGTKKIILEKIKLSKRIVLIDNKNKITPVAYNLGIKNSKGKYICLIDAHCEIAKDYLLQALKTIKQTNAENVGGPWNGIGKNYISNAIAAAFRSPFSAGGSRNHNVNFEGYTQSVWGGFFKKQVFKKTGLFDEEFIRNQDEELNFRLLKTGGKIYQSKKIKYKYFVRDKMSKLFKQYFQYGYWKIKLMQKHPVFASFRFLSPAIFVLSLIIFSCFAFFYQIPRQFLLFEIYICC